jgi:hypothetical protein
MLYCAAGQIIRGNPPAARRLREDVQKHPQIVDAYQRGDHFFAAIGYIESQSDRVFELASRQAAYAALKQVMNVRPFNYMPGLTYRRFFLPIYGRNDGDRGERRDSCGARAWMAKHSALSFQGI